MAESSVPRVSFVMATHTFDGQVERAIQSCLTQDFWSFEIVLVANGMDDVAFSALEAYCRPYPSVRLVRTEVRKLTFSLNLGLHEARGELIARMDSDDVSYPCRLKEQVAYLDAHPEISLCGSSCDLIDENEKLVGELHFPVDHGGVMRVLRRALTNSAAFCHPSVMFRRRLLLDLGGYSGFYAEDFVTWALLSRDPAVRFANQRLKLVAYRADHSGHRRNLTWKAGKALCAGTQLEMFCLTRDPRWLLGMVFNVCKTFLRDR